MAWKSQKYVNINIPASYVVNREGFTKIHQAALTRHQNSKDRPPALYPDLVTSILGPDASHTPVPDTDTAKVLKEKGLEMFYNNAPSLSILIERPS